MKYSLLILIDESGQRDTLHHLCWRRQPMIFVSAEHILLGLLVLEKSDTEIACYLPHKYETESRETMTETMCAEIDTWNNECGD